MSQKAISVLTLQGDAYRGHAKDGFILADDCIERASRKRIIDTLEKYIRHVDRDCTMYVERYYFFDQKKFEDDLQIFGVEVPK